MFIPSIKNNLVNIMIVCAVGGVVARRAGQRRVGQGAGQWTGLLYEEERQSCRERKDRLLPLRQRAVI